MALRRFARQTFKQRRRSDEQPELRENVPASTQPGSGASLSTDPAPSLSFRGSAARIHRWTRSDDPWVQPAFTAFGWVLTGLVWTAIALGHALRWLLMRFRLFKAPAEARERSRLRKLEELRHKELVEELRSVRKALVSANADLQETTEMARISRLGDQEQQPRRFGPGRHRSKVS